MARSRARGGLLVLSAVPRRGSTGHSRRRRDRIPIEVSLYNHAGGRTSTEATRPMVLTHWFREQSAIVKATIWFVAIATALYLLFGPIGILYALGLELLYLLIYLLIAAFASFLDPDVY